MFSGQMVLTLTMSGSLSIVEVLLCVPIIVVSGSMWGQVTFSPVPLQRNPISERGTVTAKASAMVRLKNIRPVSSFHHVMRPRSFTGSQKSCDNPQPTPTPSSSVPKTRITSPFSSTGAIRRRRPAPCSETNNALGNEPFRGKKETAYGLT